jgi:hypothetical protein
LAPNRIFVKFESWLKLSSSHAWQIYQQTQVYG